jgi:hypothetical protein
MSDNSQYMTNLLQPSEVALNKPASMHSKLPTASRSSCSPLATERINLTKL